MSRQMHSPIACAKSGAKARGGWSKLASFAMEHKNISLVFPAEAGARFSMLDASAYRSNETNAKRALAEWRLSNVNDPYVFQNQGFPVRADSFLDLAQILDTMQEERFDPYMKEIGGFTEEDRESFVAACLDYVDFYHSVFQRERVVLPLSTMIAHFVLYKKLCGFSPDFSRLLELGPGCGYLSFFLRTHKPLRDYTQIESTEAFYLLQSHINSHIFGSRFDEYALSKNAANDHNAYHPKLKWHDPFHYEDQKVVNIPRDPICNHFPWWRIGDAANRKYELVTTNANLNEFSREALFQYLSLIRDVLADDGVIISQCLGGGPPTYDTIFANMKSAGFVPVALTQYIVSNAVFVGEKHPLYAKYANREPVFPMADRGELDFINRMYFLNEENVGRKRIYTAGEIVAAVAGAYKIRNREVGFSGPQRFISSSEPPVPPVNSNNGSAAPVARSEMRQEAPYAVAARSHTAEIAWLERIARKEAGYVPQTNQVAPNGSTPTADVEALRRTLTYMRSSKSWRLTAPLRNVGNLMRGRPSESDEAELARLRSVYSGSALTGEIDALKASTSWRVTAPLRALMRMAGRGGSE